ncbi:MAG: glutamate mutase L [Kineosporiaceae bacterium]
MNAAPVEAVLCIDVGSTYTKAVLVSLSDSAPGSRPGSPSRAGDLLATASTPTTLTTDVLDGVAAVRRQVASAAGLDEHDLRGDRLLVCSSAGGGLRLAVVGYESLVTAEAGHRVALSAGGTVVHVHAGELDGAGLAALRAARPDVVLLVGGTDGGNAEVLLHNASRIGSARLPVPVVLAGNAEAADAARTALRDRTVRVAPNVLPRIGELAPAGARAAIREMFLAHVIGGKGLSRTRLDGVRFSRLVRAATPDAVLDGVGVLADVVGDVLLVDVGGATTDVYSAITPREADAGRREVVATMWQARTVEGDLGMRWGAAGVVVAARAERLIDEAGAAALASYARRAANDPGLLPATAADRAHEQQLAALAVRVAVRRHARPAAPGHAGRALHEVELVIGSGGVLRHGTPALRRAVLEPVTTDHAGGWKVPRAARITVDERYVVFAAGLLAADHPDAARGLLARTF